MTWLTPEEREENSRRNEDARREEYASDYDRQETRRTEGLRRRLAKVQARVSAADIRTILEAKREGLL